MSKYTTFTKRSLTLAVLPYVSRFAHVGEDQPTSVLRNFFDANGSLIQPLRDHLILPNALASLDLPSSVGGLLDEEKEDLEETAAVDKLLRPIAPTADPTTVARETAHTSLADVAPVRTTLLIHVEKPLGDGVNSVFLARAAGAKGVFKPGSGEVKDDRGKPLKKGVRWGDSAAKEVAASFLGEKAGVPHTAFAVDAATGEPGSFQAFAESVSSVEDLSSSLFARADVQRLGVLDIRLLNLDRHEGNVLVSANGDKSAASKYSLVPIDHGFSLPAYSDMRDVYFCWLYWAHCKAEWDSDVKREIAQIEPMEDAVRLHNLGVPSESVVASVLATVLLQDSVAAGKSLFQTASLVHPSDSDMSAEGEAEGTSVFQRLVNTLPLPLASYPWEKARGAESELNRAVEGADSQWAAVVRSFQDALRQQLVG